MHARLPRSDLRGELRSTEGPLHRTLGHGVVGGTGGLRIAALCWEDEPWVAMRGPVFAQDLEGGLRQRDEAIFGSFAPVDVEHHTMTVDVSGLPASARAHA